MKKFTAVLTPINWFFWGVLVFTLPVTSFPFFPFSGMGNAVVRPMSLYPLLILGITMVVLSIVSGEEISLAAAPLFFFVLAGILSTLLAYLEPVRIFRGQTTTSRAVREMATLVFGVGYFLAAHFTLKSRIRVERTVRLFYMAAVVVVFYSLLQAASIQFDFPDYDRMNLVHKLFSVRDMHPYRVHGFTYEPSWFASQINILVLPMLWAGRMAGFRVLGKGRMAAVLEWVLLILLILVLGMSYSRGGVVIGLGILVIGGVLALIMWLSRIRRKNEKTFSFSRRQVILGIVVLAGIVVFMVVIFIPMLSRYEYFMLMWKKLFETRNPFDYLMSIGGRPRLAYLEAGYNIFEEHPLLGVGLGQSGFFMLDAMPNWVYLNTLEITQLLNPYSPLFPNPKNLWVSLLAETGVVGASLFILFILNVFVQGLKYFRLKNRFGRFMGMYSVLSFMAILLSSYTLDSFATPNMWIAFGIMSAPAWPGFWEKMEEVQ